MYRRGHVGMAMFAYAPIGYLLLRERRLGLALFGLFGVLLIEPLPDNDRWIPGLRHRGTSHSLLTALLVGGVIGALGWVVGGRVAVLLANLLGSLDTATAGIFAGVFQWIADQLRALDPRALAIFGFAIGAYGILVHLFADVITISGIRPLLPLSRRRLSLSSLRADSEVANNGLFGLGVLALAVTLLVTAPGVGIALGPVDLSPVGVASAQPQNTSANVAVVFNNQTTNGSAVTVDEVTLAKPGYVAIHNSGYATGPAPAESSIIAVSSRLSSGTHHNVTVEIANAPPGNSPGLNESRLNSSETLAAVVYRDSNQNGQFDFVRSFGENDSAVTQHGRIVSDTARVSVPTPPDRTASVTVENQTVRNNSLVVRSARLPEGGFIVVQNQTYRRTGDATTSAIGVTDYLKPGNYTNLSVSLLPSALNSTQDVTVRPSLDTNDNHRYDYVQSHGVQDVAYETANHSAIVSDTALARVPRSKRSTVAQTSDSVSTGTSTSSALPTESTASAGTTAARTTSAATSGNVDDTGIASRVGLSPTTEIVILLIALAAVLVVVVRSRR